LIRLHAHGYRPSVKAHSPRTTFPSGSFLVLSIAQATALVLCFSNVARAQSESAEIEALIRQGVALRMKKQDERALPLFQQAYDRARTARTAGQLGLAEMALGYWTDAERHLLEALESPDHPWIAKNRAALESTLAQARAQIGELVVTGSPAGASVTVNGRDAGRLPLVSPIRVNKGVIEVQVRAPGYVDGTSRTRVGGRERQSVTLTLARIAPRGEKESEDLERGGKRLEETIEQKPAPNEPGVGSRSKWAWGLAAGAGIAVGVGVVETLRWQSNRIDFNNHLAPPSDNPGVMDRALWVKDCDRGTVNRGGAACKSIYDSSRRAEILAFVGYGAGVALAAGSAILFLRGDRPEPGGIRVGCAPATMLGLACKLAF
jgi:hypothetical protein